MKMFGMLPKPPSKDHLINGSVVLCLFLLAMVLILAYTSGSRRIELERANRRIEMLENRLDAINKRTDSLELFQWRQEAMAEKRKGKR